MGIAVYPDRGVGEGGTAFIRLQLSQQPPDFAHTELLYILGESGAPRIEGRQAVIPCPCRPGEWNELWFDPAADVERLGLAGGLDNSLYNIYIGITDDDRGAGTVAYFDTLRLEPAKRGGALLDELRQLTRSLTLRHAHHTGIEVSYYGHHINAFGANVPIPDYDAITSPLSSEDIVAHIHRWGGLACYNHPPTGGNRAAFLAALIESRVYGADLMEVAHGQGGLPERLHLWDRLGANGVVITGIAANDTHSAQQGWQSFTVTGRQAPWVTHLWAESLAEEDMLTAMRLGHVYIADPHLFAGTLDITGPEEGMPFRMGDVVVVLAGQEEGHHTASYPYQYPPLTARLTGVQPGDLVAWICDGHLVGASQVEKTAAPDSQSDSDSPSQAQGEGAWQCTWQPPAGLSGWHAVRIQLHRPSLVTTPFGGLIAVSNPVYFTNRPPETTNGHRLIYMKI
ncbi:MAG TPA: hypothetical protein GXX29_12080 [Firmicutes bacterium]|nr:hypothetical protein [Bacillota bacterium]